MMLCKEKVKGQRRMLGINMNFHKDNENKERSTNHFLHGGHWCGMLLLLMLLLLH